MGFRVRKSFKIAPGVRITVSPRGVSTSVGVKGVRVTRGADGRVTRTLSAPGTGISHVKTLRSATGSRALPAQSQQRVGSPAPSAAPGLMAPKWQKALHKVLVAKPDPDALTSVGQAHPEARLHAATYAAFMDALPKSDYERARQLLTWAFHHGFDPATDPFCTKYVPPATVTIGIAEGVEAQMPLDRDAIGLALAELHQEAGDLDAAVVVVESLDPSTIAAVSLAELYADQQRWRDLVELTDGLSNEDEPSTYLLTQRGQALRQLGQPGAGREALKEALRVRSRPAQLRHAALVERANCYIAEGKAGMARKDLEKVYADDSRYPGLRQALEALPS
jgi:tetratricopeptide (TPR) repeat protein